MAKREVEYTREQLIDICERAIVPVNKWSNRDSPSAQLGVYQALGLLKAGCEFNVTYRGDGCVTDERTIWLYIFHPSFGTFDHGAPGDEIHVYLPTPQRLEDMKGCDWY